LVTAYISSVRVALVSLLALISINCTAQGNIPPRKNGVVVYQGVMAVDSLTKNQLFDVTNNYLTTYFSTTKSFIYKVDKDLGTIIVKPCVNFPFKRDHTEYNGGLWHYTGTFTFKDGKYYYRLDSFYNTDFMFGTPQRQDLGDAECLYDDNTCNVGFTSIPRPDKLQSKMILKNLHRAMVNFMQEFDAGIRKK
jgi:hypothetical protein